MNKKLFFIFGSAYLLISIILSSFSNMLITNYITESTEKVFNDKTQKYLEYLGANVRNDLLLGNTRDVRNSLIKARAGNLYSEFDIFREETLLDSTLTNEKIKNDYYTFTVPIYFNEITPWGKLAFYVDKAQLANQIGEYKSKVSRFFILNIFITMVLVGICFVFLYRSALYFKFLFADLINGRELNYKRNLAKFWNELINSVQYITDENRKMLKELEQVSVDRAIIDISNQVSHDIRSPLTALNMVFGMLNNIPEEQRLLIKNAVTRINDISNQLLNKSKSSSSITTNSSNESNETEENPGLTIELLPALVDMLVSEKRIQFRDKININIETDLQESYGAFVNVNSIEIKRVLSNLITNAVEALGVKQNGRVIVSVKNYSSKIILSVRDNGSGIPQHILQLLGQKGITHGKEGTQSGSGLGVYHAKQTIESFGAEFIINTQEGCGTEIRMVFIPAEMPVWFVDELKFKSGQQITVLDDDSAIHSVWSERLSGLPVKINNFTSGLRFTEWVSNNTNQSGQFLVDYELLGQNKTGLQIIEDLGIANKSILVTSRFEDEEIRKKCSKLGVKLIPKTMAGLVPIEV